MFRRSTVLVLGAGSSVEFGLPAGDGLAQSIIGKLAFSFADGVNQSGGDGTIYRALKRANPAATRDLFQAGNKIARGLALSRSIDDFLYNHSDDSTAILAGKAAIASSILDAERHSRLYWRDIHGTSSRDEVLHSQSRTWLYNLFRYIQTDVRRVDVENIFGNISIVNFNYDRCVEHFLYWALQAAYTMEPDDAAAVMKTLDIHHPYGRVGELPWERSGAPATDFGETLHEVRIMELAGQIKTYTEQSHSDDEKERWRSRIRAADQIAFLGFAYHKQNMDLLAVGDRPMRSQAVYGTTFGASQPDCQVFRDRIVRSIWANRVVSGQAPVFIPHECAQFIREYGLQLES